jgi:hypothetical protein
VLEAQQATSRHPQESGVPDDARAYGMHVSSSSSSSYVPHDLARAYQVMCVCVCVAHTYTHTHTHTHTHTQHTDARTHTDACMSDSASPVCVCARARMCVCIHTYTQTSSSRASHSIGTSPLGEGGRHGSEEKGRGGGRGSNNGHPLRGKIGGRIIPISLSGPRSGKKN